MTVEKPASGSHEQQNFKPAVRTYSADLASRIGRVLAESATLSQALDRTFPNRLLARMRDSTTPPDSEAALRHRLGELEQQRIRLAKAGLLEKSDESAFIPQDRFDEATRKLLSEYVGDTKQKLSAYENLLSKIELLVEIINKRFQFKQISIDRNKGFLFTDVRGVQLEAESLSSGEQHELILMFDLLFRTKKDTLLLIDEPEISLHIAWQRRFLPDIRRIIDLTDIDVVFATHSPQLVGENLDLAVQLKAPGNGKSIQG